MKTLVAAAAALTAATSVEGAHRSPHRAILDEASVRVAA
jgi:hypothetical protein